MVLANLTAITNRDESLAAFELLKRNLRNAARPFEGHTLTWQGGSGQFDTYWRPDLGFWAVLEPIPPTTKKGTKHRFWNCFGIQDPGEHTKLRITVEINPPHEGRNFRVAGRFAQDSERRIYIGHTGKVGGGKTGIGKDSFREYFALHQWSNIEIASGTESILALGPIDGSNFSEQVADFVRKVADFKNSAKP